MVNCISLLDTISHLECSDCMHIFENAESHSTHIVHSHAVAIHSVVICYFKETLRKSHIPFKMWKSSLSLALWPCHTFFPSVAFLGLGRLHWYRDLVWVFSQLGCLLEALWPCEFLIHPTAHHVCEGTAASSRPKTQQQAPRAGLRRIACPIFSVAFHRHEPSWHTYHQMGHVDAEQKCGKIKCLNWDLNH